jgi:hypothetical protein
MVYPLMNLEVLDMQVKLPIDLIFDEEPQAQQFAYDGLPIPFVVGHSLDLELLRRSVEVAIVVGEVQRCDEH